MDHKKFIPLFEILTGKKHELTEKIIKSQEEAEKEEITEETPEILGGEKFTEETMEALEEPAISLEPEILPEVEITPPPTTIEEEIIEVPEEIEKTPIEEEEVERIAESIESSPIAQEIKEFKEIEKESKDIEQVEPKSFAEIKEETYEKSEEIISEAREYSYIKEKKEGKKKIVEGGEDIKRKLIISIDVEEDLGIQGNGKHEVKNHESESMRKSDEGKFKIISMEDKEVKKDKIQPEEETKRFYEHKSSRVFLQEIIDRIRSDIIAKAEIDSRKITNEAEKRAKEIIDNAYKESEKIINEALSRSMDISREIEKESEEKGYKAGFEKGYEEGKQKGYEDAYKKTISEGRYALEIFRKISDELAYAKERFSDDFPKIVLHLTLVAIKTILMTNFIKDEELIVRVLKDAMEKVREFKIVKIRANSQDIETIKNFFQIPPEVEIIPDPSVEKGDVKIEMREGYFESSIKWREKIIEETLKAELESLIQKKDEEENKLKTKMQEAEKEIKEKIKEGIKKEE